MSKHPIPDWLRSQFSRIEDEVRKLGPCGVFTQMRTVTQTYFEQAAAAPQPPALGGDVEVLAATYQDHTVKWVTPNWRSVPAGTRLIDSAHLAPLQAEIERLEHLVEVGKVEFDRLGHDHVLAVCRNAAYSCLEQHSYMQSLKTEYQSWAPHKWVIDAIRSLIGINRSTCENLREERDQLKARNAELEGVLQMFIDNSDDRDVVELSRNALSKPAPSECCAPTAEERALLAAGDCTPEELWGGPRPTCPKCIKPAGGDSVSCNNEREDIGVPLNTPCKACGRGPCIDR